MENRGQGPDRIPELDRSAPIRFCKPPPVARRATVARATPPHGSAPWCSRTWRRPMRWPEKHPAWKRTRDPGGVRTLPVSPGNHRGSMWEKAASVRRNNPGFNTAGQSWRSATADLPPAWPDDRLWGRRPRSQDEPGSMKAVRAPTAATHRRTASATNSGPLSERVQAGINRSVITSMTSVEESLRRTRMARLSRVNSSRTLSMRKSLPSCVR